MKKNNVSLRKALCELLFTWFFIVLFFILNNSPLFSQGLPDGYNELFAGSGECAVCHNSQVSADGLSVAIANDWRSTMMANSSRDPLWRAKVSTEVNANPMHKEFIEDKCSKCHAPAGNVNSHHIDGGDYLLSTLSTDPYGQDGVQCTVCHQITPSSMGTNSAAFTIGTEKSIYGPYEAPFAGPMVNSTGYTPMFSAHIDNSELCGTCHTLLTHPVSPEGEVYENEFVEQAILQEWKNSKYPEENTNCQTCHIPRIAGPVIISNTPPWLGGQDFFGQHHFVGANIFMNRIFQENAEDINLTTSLTQLQDTESRTRILLQERAVALSVDELERNESSLKINCELKNLSGHKLPAGFPSRRVFIEFIAVDALGDTIFHSGKTTPDFRIIGEDSAYEPHHDIISEDNQVQIYQMVMGDDAGNPTTELLRAHNHLKDNRLPPEGFTSGHISYDTVRLVGGASQDQNFNLTNGFEGSGSDIILYDIPITSNTGRVEVIVRVFYQTISPEWLDDIFSRETPETGILENMYEKSGGQPVLMASEKLVSQSTSKPDVKIENGISIFPNPVIDELNIEFQNELMASVYLHDLNGKLIRSYAKRQNESSMHLNVGGCESGVYILRIQQGNQKHIEKIFLL